MGARRKQHRQEKPVGNGSVVETTRAPESHPLRRWGGGKPQWNPPLWWLRVLVWLPSHPDVVHLTNKVSVVSDSDLCVFTAGQLQWDFCGKLNESGQGMDMKHRAWSLIALKLHGEAYQTYITIPPALACAVTKLLTLYESWYIIEEPTYSFNNGKVIAIIRLLRSEPPRMPLPRRSSFAGSYLCSYSESHGTGLARQCWVWWDRMRLSCYE